MGSLRDRVKKGTPGSKSVPPKPGEPVVEGPAKEKPQVHDEVPPTPKPAPSPTVQAPVAPKEDEGERVSVSDSDVEVKSSPPPASPAAEVAEPDDIDAIISAASATSGKKEETPKEVEEPPPSTKAEPKTKKPEPKTEPAPPKAIEAKKEKRTRAWQFEKDDNGTEFKVNADLTLVFIDATANGLKFKLKGKEPKTFELGLDESRTFNVEGLEFTVKNTGVNSDGKLEMSIVTDDAQTTTAKASAAVSKAAATTGKAFSKVGAYWLEIFFGVGSVAAPILAYAGGETMREALGTVGYYLFAVGTPAVMVPLTIWEAITRKPKVEADVKALEAKGES